MATYDQISARVTLLASYIDGQISHVEQAANITQSNIYEYLSRQLLNFETQSGKFVVGQDIRKNLVTIENRLEKYLNAKEFKIPVRDFLQNFDTIQDRTTELHKYASALELPTGELSPAKEIIKAQATTALSRGIAENYIEPVKRLVANNVLNGASIQQTVKALEKWDKGALSSGREAQGIPTPNLQRYATQIARDSAYQVSRTTNKIFQDRFNLTKFIYAGNIIADTRPICRHLVNLDRPIEVSEMGKLIAAYPEGLYPGTTAENFIETCGGFNCRHEAFVVK